MKRIIVLIVLLLLPLVCFANDVAERNIFDTTTANVEIKTAIIHYKSNGKQTNGRLIVYIDGNKKAAETFNDKDEKTRLEFFDGHNSYQVLLLDNVAVKLDDPLGLLTAFYFLKEPSKENFLKKDVFLGKECNVYQMQSGTYYFWKGIMLKRDFNTSFSLITEAVNIEINVPVPSDKFVVPSKMKFVTLKEGMRLELNRTFKEIK